LPLGIAPEAAEFLAVFAAFFRKPGGDVFDAFESLFDGHRFYPV
jgi:hypothetical protein